MIVSLLSHRFKLLETTAVHVFQLLGVTKKEIKREMLA